MATTCGAASDLTIQNLPSTTGTLSVAPDDDDEDDDDEDDDEDVDESNDVQ